MFEYFPIIFVLWCLDWFHYCQTPYFVWFCLFLSVMTQDMARWMFQVQLKWIPTLLCSDARLRNTSAGWYSVLHLCSLSYYFYLLMREECWIPTPALQLCCGFIYSRTREILLKLSCASCHLLVSDGLASILRDTEAEMGNLPPAWWCFKFPLVFPFNDPATTYFPKSSNRCSMYSTKILWLHSVQEMG